MSAQPSAAGWYPDPQDPLMLRWWDGAAWTGATTPAASETDDEPGLKPLYDDVPQLAREEQAREATQARQAPSAPQQGPPAPGDPAVPVLPGGLQPGGPEPTLDDVRRLRAARANAKAEQEIARDLGLDPRPPTQSVGRSFVSALGSTAGMVARGLGSALVWSLTRDRYGRRYGSWRSNDWDGPEDYRGL